MLEINRIYNQDCLDGMIELEDESVDLIITSPPYKEVDGYNPIILSSVFNQCFRILKSNSLFFLNFGHLANNKIRPFRICEIALDRGFELNDTIIWEKTQFSPVQGNKRVNNLTEFIFLLYKGKMPNLNRLSIGIPYKDKSNIGRYSDKDLRCAGNIWKFGYETIQSKKQKLHKDRFPIELPTRCIKLSGLKEGIVFDPFSGSGSTQVAAKMLGLNYLGFEISLEYTNIANQRLDSL